MPISLKKKSLSSVRQEIVPLVILIDEGLVVLPKTVDGKLVILKDNIYQTISFGRYAIKPSNDQIINPEHYAVLKTDRYTCIIDCKASWIRRWKIRKAYDEHMTTGYGPYLTEGTVI